MSNQSMCLLHGVTNGFRYFQWPLFVSTRDVALWLLVTRWVRVRLLSHHACMRFRDRNEWAEFIFPCIFWAVMCEVHTHSWSTVCFNSEGNKKRTEVKLWETGVCYLLCCDYLQRYCWLHVASFFEKEWVNNWRKVIVISLRRTPLRDTPKKEGCRFHLHDIDFNVKRANST